MFRPALAWNIDKALSKRQTCVGCVADSVPKWWLEHHENAPLEGLGLLSQGTAAGMDIL